MKIGGARAEAFSAMRKRALAQAGAQVTAQQAAPMDKAAFLGLGETDLTPAVQGAIRTLLTEIDDLRGEVGRLKGRLSEVEGLADRDVLTPLLNRRAFVRELNRVAAFGARYGTPASLVYFDLDGFKTVNDRFGHAAGDAALETANAKAESLKRAIESTPVDLGDWSAPLRVSYGVRAVEPGADPETALAEADARMFVRKKMGGA